MPCNLSSSDGTRSSVGRKRKGKGIPRGDVAKRVCVTAVTVSQTERPSAPGSRYQCPVAKRFGCSLKFKSKTEANAHRDAQHPEPFPCPVAIHYRCKRSFGNAAAANEHARQHRLRWLCPVADEFNCKKSFVQKGHALRHASTHARSGSGRTHPCPSAETYHCNKMFYTRQTAQQHGKCHLKPTVQCPHATETGCTKMFTSTGNAAEHGRLHCRTPDEKRVPCPLSEEYKCEQLFFTMNDARQHSKIHYERHPCPKADTFHCTEIFSRRRSALAHAKMAHGSRWLCTVPLCYRAVARLPHTKRSVVDHMRIHRERGDLEDLKAEATPFEVSETTGSNNNALSLTEDDISNWEAEAADADNQQNFFPWLYEINVTIEDETARTGEKTQAMNSSIRGLHTTRPMPTWTSQLTSYSSQVPRSYPKS